jgi:hypothetical protein
VLGAALVLFVLIRFGFLALVTALFFARRLTLFPPVLDTGVWYAGTAWTVLLALAAVAAYAFRIALRRGAAPPD